MKFPDPAIPIATCEADGCEECSISETVHCHFELSDLVHFYLICLPSFLVGGAGVLAVGFMPLMIWIALCVGFFGFIETRVLCSHCPHYAEEGASLRCWANYGSPKLFKYRPGPMSTVEKAVLLGGFAVAWGYPLVFLVVGESWYLLALYLLLVAGLYVNAKKSFCSRCMNFACPLNDVSEPVRQVFRECNPVVGRAWGVDPGHPAVTVKGE